MTAPFAFYGGKSQVAERIWQRFGDPKFYVEPFGGTLATLLARPKSLLPSPQEAVGDADEMIVNFWRAVRFDSRKVAHWAIGPVSGVELQSRHKWLRAQRSKVEAKLRANPNWYDAKIAGWWVWVTVNGSPS